MVKRCVLPVLVCFTVLLISCVDVGQRASHGVAEPQKVERQATVKSQQTTRSETVQPACRQQWFIQTEEQLATGDQYGHGPDLGSLEWRSAVEFKLGLRDNPLVPPLNTDAWCRYIEGIIVKKSLF